MTAPIVRHPLWPELAEYIKAEACGAGEARKQRYRIEVRQMPSELRERALAVEVPCCACGAAIRPIRERRQPGNKRSESTGHGLYYAAACSLEVRVGCSRGRAAKENYAAIVRVLGAPGVAA